MIERNDEMVRQLATDLRERGFATPAMMLMDLVSPVSYFGEQFLLALGPLIPFRHWRAMAHTLVTILRDDESRDLLHNLLQD